MKHFKPLMLLIVPLMLGGCIKRGQKQAVPTEGKVNVHIKSLVGGSDDDPGKEVSINFADSYFNNSATEFSNELKMLSFGASIAASKEETATEFYATMGFDNFVAHYPEPGEDTIGYAFAHKSIGKKVDLVSLSIRGFEYKTEWANNITIGKEGNHAGFEACAEEILGSMVDYLDAYKKHTVKLWVSGYSRAGGVANVLASKLMSDNSPVQTNQDNLFVYTYEAPRGLTEANAIHYENVFNMINEGDIVAKIAPEAYGLYRCGKDVIINSGKDVDALTKAFDPNTKMPAFTPSADQYADEQQFCNYLLNKLLEETEDETASISTREAFVDNYQQHLSYVIGLFFSLPDATVNKIKDKFKSLGMFDIIGLLAEDGLYNFLHPILDEDEIPYQAEKLQPACNGLVKLVTAKIELALTIYTSEGAKNNAIRSLYLHSPETVYVLMK